MIIPQPSSAQVRLYLKEWDRLEDYVDQELALEKLFRATYPSNTKLDEVLIKVSCLNDFYNLRIWKTYYVAKHILSLKIDTAINKGDLAIVKKIARVKMRNGNVKNFYSFATKYCNHHNPEEYPIYDYYVQRVLTYFKSKDKFDEFTREDLKDYKRFKKILLNFRSSYGLEMFSLKQIDRYIWLLGKEHFKGN